MHHDYANHDLEWVKTYACVVVGALGVSEAGAGLQRPDATRGHKVGSVLFHCLDHGHIGAGAADVQRNAHIERLLVLLCVNTPHT